MHEQRNTQSTERTSAANTEKTLAQFPSFSPPESAENTPRNFNPNEKNLMKKPETGDLKSHGPPRKSRNLSNPPGDGRAKQVAELRAGLREEFKQKLMIGKSDSTGHLNSNKQGRIAGSVKSSMLPGSKNLPPGSKIPSSSDKNNSRSANAKSTSSRTNAKNVKSDGSEESNENNRRDTWNGRVSKHDFKGAGEFSSYEPKSSVIQSQDSRYSRYNDISVLDEALNHGDAESTIRKGCQTDHAKDESGFYFEKEDTHIVVKSSSTVDEDEEEEKAKNSPPGSPKKMSTLKDMIPTMDKPKKESKKKVIKTTTLECPYGKKTVKHRTFIREKEIQSIMSGLGSINEKAALDSGINNDPELEAKLVSNLYKKIMFIVVMPDEARAIREAFYLEPDTSLEDDPFVEAWCGDVFIPKTSSIKFRAIESSMMAKAAGGAKNANNSSVKFPFHPYGRTGKNAGKGQLGKISVASNMQKTKSSPSPFSNLGSINENEELGEEVSSNTADRDGYEKKQIWLVSPRTEANPDAVVSICPEPAAVACCIGIRRYNPDLVVSVGTCGGIQPADRTMKHGDLIIPRRCFYLGKEFVGASKTPKFAGFLNPEYPVLDPGAIVEKVTRCQASRG